ncbi:MAG: aspartate-semialdehyde dehydrogenase [Lentisphaeria bacterium]|nr:aspartate-semialdehyde dehydrogenase [Lentisphaeria bacterium]
MGRSLRVAVAGATGAVGIEMVKTLERRNFPVSEIKLLASARSAGKTMKFKGEDVVIQEMTKDSFNDVDIALFSAGSSISKEYAPIFRGNKNVVMIDNSSCFRMDEDVPLVVPEVNAEDAFKHNGIIANPNCTTAIMCVAVYPLHKAKGLKRMVAATYQAASGGGAKAMQELIDQTADVLAGKPAQVNVMAQRIAFNLFPHIDSFLDNGYTKEEMKMFNEARKIMHLPDLMLSCSCVRVPVLRAHSESLNMEFEQDITPEEAREIIKNSPGVILCDDPANKVYPMPIDATDKFDVLVGRIRQDVSRNDKKGLEMFISGDQLLKGAALNAVQIAEVLNR